MSKMQTTQPPNPQNGEKVFPFWQQLVFSETILTKNKSHKIAYIAVMTAFIIAANFLEIKFLDNQFSFTIVVSLLVGILIGPLYGFCACMLGDFIGYLANPGYLYMPWVGLSTGMFALIAGLIFNLIPTKKKWFIYLKLMLICIITFFVCTICINSTGFYLYNQKMGFSTAVIEYVSKKFGGNVTFGTYVCYRLFFKGQIYNSLVNYALLFFAVPVLKNIKPLRIFIS